MERIVRQCVGIDVSKDTLDIALCIMNAKDFKVSTVASYVFDNNLRGIKKLMSWINKNKVKNEECQILVEATGVYHEELTYQLFDSGFYIAVVVPSKIYNYIKSTSIRAVTDKISAKMIAEYGLHQKVEKWEKPKESLRLLKALTRERVHLLEDATVIKNRKHAYKASALSHRSMEKRFDRLITVIEEQVKNIEYELHEIVNADKDLKSTIDRICKVRGIGFLTVVSIAAETDGFKLFTNQRQLVCYSGYDIIIKESGTSVKAKASISHRGNKYIRRALHFPAISAAKGDYFKDLFKNLFERQKIKMKSYTAIQRKLLILIYTLWKNGEEFDIQRNKTNFVKTGEVETSSGENQLVRNNLSDWNGQEGDKKSPSFI